MAISEYDEFDVRTSQPIRLPPITTCAMEGCLNQCESKSATCRTCREDETRRKIRGVDPQPISYAPKQPYCKKTQMTMKKDIGTFIGAMLALFAGSCFASDYPIIYVRSAIVPNVKPRINDIEKPVWSEPGSKLMLLPANGVPEVLFDAGVNGGVLDPCPSLDGKWVYFSHQPDARHLINVGTASPSDIYKINVETRQVVRLTFNEMTRISDVIKSQYELANARGTSGVHNVGACPIPGGRVIFESSRNLQQSTRDTTSRFYYEPHLQLFVMDEDGKNVEQIGYLNLGGSRHPTLMKDGRIMWSSGEFHGLRTNKAWGLWVSEPDGRTWGPLWSAMITGSSLTSLHWQSQTPNGNVQLELYYGLQQQGYGNLFDFPQPSVFGSPDPLKNAILKDRALPGLRYSLQPDGAKSLTPWATGIDSGGPKVTHPSAAPDGLLVSHGITGTDATGLGGTMMLRQAGIYRVPYVDTFPTPPQTAKQAIVVNAVTDLVKVIDDPGYFETQPKALVSWEQVYGIAAPERPWIPNSSSTPFGFVGTSGVYARESAPIGPLARDPSGKNWGQGGDVGTYANSDIDKVRILIQRPTSKDGLEIYPAQSKTWLVTKLERMAVLGEITLHKRDAAGALIKDSTGDPDTSFLAKIPADHSWTFQLLDKHGQVLTHAFTWHQVRPGETRTDCRGCHGHNKPGIQFEGTEASKPGFAFADLTTVKPKTVEWVKDIQPLLDAKCKSCHGSATSLPVGFNVTDPLAIRDSKWVTPFMGRTSPIMKRLLNTDVAARCPKGGEPLPAEDIKTIATWIDLGTPRDMGRFYTDNQRPVLYVGSPQRTQASLTQIKFGAFEVDGTIASISVKASFAVAGRAVNAELYDLFPAPVASVWTLPIAERPTSGTVTVVVTDDSGRAAKIDRAFTLSGGLTPEQIAAIQAQIAAINTQIATLTSQVAALQAQLQ